MKKIFTWISHCFLIGALSLTFLSLTHIPAQASTTPEVNNHDVNLTPTRSEDATGAQASECKDEPGGRQCQSHTSKNVYDGCNGFSCNPQQAIERAASLAAGQGDPRPGTSQQEGTQ